MGYYRVVKLTARTWAVVTAKGWGLCQDHQKSLRARHCRCDESNPEGRIIPAKVAFRGQGHPCLLHVAGIERSTS